MSYKNLNKTLIKNYNLKDSLLGGQSFAWDLNENGFYYGFKKDKVIKIKQENDCLYWQTYPQNNDAKYIENYLRLNEDYEKILKKISKDIHVKSAIKKYPNLRILKQDFEQTLLSYIISSSNTIKNIRKSVRLLSRKFGELVVVDGIEIYLFPKTEVLAGASLEDILECKLGFRAKYFKKAAEHLISTNLKEKIYKMDEEKARESLKEIPGIGDKIADCILCYSLGFDNVIPMDTWVKKVFVNYYKLNPKIKFPDAREWSNKYFENYGAWAGQFLFEYIRGFEAEKYKN